MNNPVNTQPNSLDEFNRISIESYLENHDLLSTLHRDNQTDEHKDYHGPLKNVYYHLTMVPSVKSDIYRLAKLLQVNPFDILDHIISDMLRGAGIFGGMATDVAYYVLLLRAYGKLPLDRALRKFTQAMDEIYQISIDIWDDYRDKYTTGDLYEEDAYPYCIRNFGFVNLEQLDLFHLLSKNTYWPYGLWFWYQLYHIANGDLHSWALMEEQGLEKFFTLVKVFTPATYTKILENLKDHSHAVAKYIEKYEKRQQGKEQD